MVDRAGMLPTADTRGGLALGVILSLALAVRVIGLGQPIVENYVGRQIPTAMVARNLDRGSGFLNPSLDVAPFPNRFLVEPPLYQAVTVALRRAAGLPLEASGRLVSAIGIVAGAWGVFGLTARRSGRPAGLLAAAAFATFPVTVRYGRAFQPDALMIGSIVAGVRCWDEAEARGGRSWPWLVAAFLTTSAGLAMKVISAYVLVPILAVVVRDRRPAKVALVLGTLVPVLLWYAHSASLMAEGAGSRASADNGAIWLRALSPSGLLPPEALGHLLRYVGFRAFTPLGTALAVVGLITFGHGNRLWHVWGAAAIAALLAISSKVHHEYYLLALAVVAAAGVGQALDGMSARGGAFRAAAGLAAAALLALDAAFSFSTFRTPPEWRSLGEAAGAVQACVPADAWVAAPEALLYAADRRGCRVEFTRAAARRAAGEWEPSGGQGPTEAVEGPIDLVEFYRHRGARFFADVGADPATPDLPRLALHEAVRRRYNVIVDRSGVLIASLDEPPRPDADDGAPVTHGTRPPSR